jgi:hypothetical protein
MWIEPIQMSVKNDVFPGAHERWEEEKRRNTKCTGRGKGRT